MLLLELASCVPPTVTPDETKRNKTTAVQLTGSTSAQRNFSHLPQIKPLWQTSAISAVNKLMPLDGDQLARRRGEAVKRLCYVVSWWPVYRALQYIVSVPDYISSDTI